MADTAAPLTREEIELIRPLHVGSHPGKTSVCQMCGQFMPCHASRLLATLDARAGDGLRALLAVADAAQTWLDYWTEQSNGLLMDDTEKALARKARAALAALGKEADRG